MIHEESFVALMLYYLVSDIYIYNGVWLELPHGQNKYVSFQSNCAVLKA